MGPRAATLLALLALLALMALPGAIAHGDHTEAVAASPMLAHNATYAFTFAKPGEYVYHCHPHPWMTGVVTVTDASAPPKNHTLVIIDGGIQENAGAMMFRDEETGGPYTFAGVGDTLRWTNVGNLSHNVILDIVHPEKSSAGPAAPVAAVVVLACAVLAARRRPR